MIFRRLKQLLEKLVPEYSPERVSATGNVALKPTQTAPKLTQLQPHPVGL